VSGAGVASSAGRPPRAGALAAVGGPLSISGAIAPPPPSPGCEAVRTRIEEILNTARAARWIEQSFERAGNRMRAARPWVLRAVDGRLRRELLDGDRAGACLVRRGDRVTVRPSGLFGGLRLSFHGRDEPVRSPRGRAFDEVGFTAPPRDLLKGLEEARLEPAPGGAAIAIPSDAGARMRVELSGEPLMSRASRTPEAAPGSSGTPSSGSRSTHRSRCVSSSPETPDK
jgi:hypothetical protein